MKTETKQRIPQDVASRRENIKMNIYTSCFLISRQPRAQCLTRRVEGVCFLSAELPAKTPRVRDTGCGYSARG